MISTVLNDSLLTIFNIFNDSHACTVLHIFYIEEKFPNRKILQMKLEPIYQC